MGKLKWDQTGEKTYETGIDQGVLYPQVNAAYPKGVAWNGLSSVSESPSGADENAIYADNIKYLVLRSAEDIGFTIEAYTYPDEWEACDGIASMASGVKIGQQTRQSFGLSYRTKIGNDTDGDSHGYKLHLAYNCSASPSERSYQTVNDSPEAISFSWEISTTPVTIEGFKPASLITIDSTKVDSTKLATLEEILYGSDGTATYTEFSGSEFEDGVDYYTRTGSDPNYVYTKTTDTTPQSGTTYYTKSVSGAADPRLPLPDEIQRLFAAG